MNRKTAELILGIEFPITPGALKQAYHRRALELHPDLKGGSDEDEIKQLTEAFAYIKNECSSLISENGEEGDKFTIDGFELCELGLGLGPTTNGRNCDECGGRGHVPVLGTEREPCGGCDDGTIHLHKAYPKAYSPGTTRWCFVCRGSGVSRKIVDTRKRRYCHLCKGTGEIKIYNPVIPKGALGA